MPHRRTGRHGEGLPPAGRGCQLRPRYRGRSGNWIPRVLRRGTLGVTCATSDQLYNYDFSGTSLFRIRMTRVADPRTADLLPEYGSSRRPALSTSWPPSGFAGPDFTVSGYGLTYKNQPQNGKPNISFRERLVALAHLVNLNSATQCRLQPASGQRTGPGWHL